jgi:hypothetical protein
MLEVMSWLVLIVVIISTLIIVVFLAALPGQIARSRNHPWAQAVTVAGWVLFFFGFVFWPLAVIWAYVDVPVRRSASMPQ